MKKVILACLIFLLIGFSIWISLPKIVSSSLSKKYEIPVSIQKIYVTPHILHLQDLQIDNIPPAKTKTAFLSQSLTIQSSLSQLKGNPLTIDAIKLKDIDITIELYDSKGEKNNWRDLLQTGAKEKHPSNKNYLIKLIALDQIRVTLIDSAGKQTKIPTIEHLEFSNISNTSGFPIEKLEKAIMYQIMRAIFQSAGLQDLLDTLNPFKALPQIFHLPFLGSKKIQEKPVALK